MATDDEPTEKIITTLKKLVDEELRPQLEAPAVAEDSTLDKLLQEIEQNPNMGELGKHSLLQRLTEHLDHRDVEIEAQIEAAQRLKTDYAKFIKK